MLLKKLDQSFYDENTHLKEVLDLKDGVWIEGKTRGYGIVLIELNGLTFGVPVRSNIRHKASYITNRSNQPGILGKGLDYSKALLLAKPDYISSMPFKIDTRQHELLKDKAIFISKSFEKYVTKYVRAIRKADSNVLTSNEYRYTTLQNYHIELGIEDLTTK